MTGAGRVGIARPLPPRRHGTGEAEICVCRARDFGSRKDRLDSHMRATDGTPVLTRHARYDRAAQRLLPRAVPMKLVLLARPRPGF